MKTLLYLSLSLLPLPCLADTFIMKDGARLEGEVTGEMDNTLLIRTPYGSLTLNKEDIQERIAPPPPPPPPAAIVEISSPTQSVEIATQTAVETSTAQPEAVVEAAPKLTFRTVLPSTMTRSLVYYENGVVVATETLTAGAPALAEGVMPDGTYTEYYPEGGLKTVKTMMSGKANGTLKAYYPSGALQAEAYYLAGGKDGALKYYTESGALLMQAEYRNDLLNGWRRDYAPDGAVVSEQHYIDDVPAPPPGAPAAAAPQAVTQTEPDSQLTVRSMKIARGERFSFHLNGKYVGKAHLDKDFNLISRDGKLPDGTVKAYTADGRLEKVFVFEKNVLKTLRVYEPGGPLKAEYAYEKDKAVKK